MTKFRSFAAVSCAALMFAACSDDNDLNNSKPQIAEKYGVEVSSVTDVAALSSRVTNYKSGASRAAASSELLEGLSMPDQDSWNYTDAEKLIGDVKVESGTESAVKKYIINGGKEYTFSGALNNVEIYVKGKLIVQSIDNADNAKIVILKGGTIEVNNKDICFGRSGIAYYNYGTFTTTNQELYIYGGALFNDGEIPGLRTDKKLNIQGRFVAGGNLLAKDITILDGARVNVEGDLRAIAKDPNAGTETATPESELLTDITIKGFVNVSGKVYAKNISIESVGELYTGCSVHADEKFLMNSNVARAYVNRLYAKDIYQCAGSEIHVPNHGIVRCENYENANDGNDANITIDGDNASAVVCAQTMKWNGSLSPKFLKTPGNGSYIVVECSKFYPNSGTEVYNKDQVDFEANVVYASEVKYEIKADETCDGNGYKSSGTEDINGKELDLISTITYPNGHTHDISATCVQPANGKLYVSYHRRGVKQAGCVEVFTPSTYSTTINQYVEAKGEDLEFNHLCVDASNSRVILAGSSSEKGAIFATLALRVDGGFDTWRTEAENDNNYQPMQVVAIDNSEKAANGDANAVIVDGDKIHVAYTGGYASYNRNSIEEQLAKVATSGKAKHLAIAGSTIAGLNFKETYTDTISGNGEIRIFNAGGIDNAQVTFEVGQIAPNNGKNVVAIDGDNVYVCKGYNGFACYDKAGNEKWTYTDMKSDGSKAIGSCNGCAFDSNYIYLACGTRGVLVLDKTGKRVARKSAGGKSANYVCVDPVTNNIYVAYGQDRLQVFKLSDRLN